MEQDRARYAPGVIWAHWLTVALLLGVYLCGALRGQFPHRPGLQAELLRWHEMLGLTVWCLTWAHLLLRFVSLAPPISPAPPAWILRVASVTEAALFAFLLLVPFMGWLVLSAEGQPIPFWSVHWVPLIAPNPALGARIEAAHELIAYVGLPLIGIHAAAALAHHYLRHDNTLQRMRARRG